MAISFPIQLPSAPGFRASRFGGTNAVAVATSPFTFQQQVYEHQGQMWRADLTLPPMRRELAEAWLAALLSLRGRRGTFLLGDPDAKAPRGTWAGTPVVRGAGQTGLEIAIDGLAEGATIKAGDYFQLGTGASSRLYKVLSDVTADATGAVTLDIWPRLRESPADNAVLTISNPKGLFRLASNAVEWDADHASIYGISFSAVEAI